MNNISYIAQIKSKKLSEFMTDKEIEENGL